MADSRLFDGETSAKVRISACGSRTESIATCLSRFLALSLSSRLISHARAILEWAGGTAASRERALG